MTPDGKKKAQEKIREANTLLRVDRKLYERFKDLVSESSLPIKLVTDCMVADTIRIIETEGGVWDYSHARRSGVPSRPEKKPSRKPTESKARHPKSQEKPSKPPVSDLVKQHDSEETRILVLEMKEKGVRFKDIATELNKRGLKTAKGNDWKAHNVNNLIHYGYGVRKTG